jgi:hypothetical protein
MLSLYCRVMPIAGLLLGNCLSVSPPGAASETETPLVAARRKSKDTDTTKENRFAQFAVEDDDGPAATVLQYWPWCTASRPSRTSWPIPPKAYQMGYYEPYARMAKIRS